MLASVAVLKAGVDPDRVRPRPSAAYRQYAIRAKPKTDWFRRTRSGPQWLRDNLHQPAETAVDGPLSQVIRRGIADAHARPGWLRRSAAAAITTARTGWRDVLASANVASVVVSDDGRSVDANRSRA